MPVSQFDQINVVVLTNMKAFTRQWIHTGPLRRKSDVCLAAKQFCSATLLLLHILKSEWKPTCQQSNYAASRWLCWGKVILLRLQVLWSLILSAALQARKRVFLPLDHGDSLFSTKIPVIAVSHTEGLCPHVYSAPPSLCCYVYSTPLLCCDSADDTLHLSFCVQNLRFSVED